MTEVSPSGILGRVGGRPKNSDRRPREHLFAQEVEAMVKAARGLGRHGLRDSLMILMSFRHGLRASELVDLRKEYIDWTTAHIYMPRLKNGHAATHQLSGPELRQLRQLAREQDKAKLIGPWIFLSERGAPLGRKSVQRIVERAGQVAGIPFPVHPHMLRHACGHALAMKGEDTRAIQDYMGHKDIKNTVRYTALSPERFAGFKLGVGD